MTQVRYFLQNKSSVTQNQYWLL